MDKNGKYIKVMCLQSTLAVTGFERCVLRVAAGFFMVAGGTSVSDLNTLPEGDLK